ncbi:MAG: hypothetical protein H7318_19990 [Oligoflexus sp.]|nr:hypothetical protein [Oligoflexus sp.]
MTNINCIESERATFTDPKYLNSAIEDRCKSTGTKQVAPYFRLKRYTYDGVMKLFENEEKVGNDVWQYIVGDYIVRASCSSEAPDHSLIVKAIPKGGKFKLTGKPIDWDSKEALIIGRGTAYEACVTPKFVDMDCSSRFSCSIYTPEISEQKKY